MKQTLNDSELSTFAGQLAMILHSGISTLEGVMILKEDMPAGEGQDTLNTVYEALEETGELAESMRKSEVFPDYFIKMTEIGERSGTLEEVMDSLSTYYDRQNTLFRSVKDALTYPLILIGMLFAVLIVLMTQVMPVFEQVFEQLGIEVSGVTGTVFTIGNIMQGGSAVLIIFFVALVIAGLAALRSQSFRARMFSVIGHIPFVKTVYRLLACARFSNALALALHSGLDMGESFELASGLTDQPEFQERLKAASEQIDQGTELGEALRDAEVFSGLNARMVSLGFRTGSAETALNKISVRCQEDADERIQSAVGALEPTLTAILSVLTGLILVSVMLPLLSVMANIG